MCGKCAAINTKIERFKRIRERITDQPAVEGLTRAIAELKAEKAALHHERK
jgi:hypothetical protein